MFYLSFDMAVNAGQSTNRGDRNFRQDKRDSLKEC